MRHEQQLERAQEQNRGDLEMGCGGWMLRPRLAREQKSRVSEKNSLLGQRLPSWEDWKRRVNRAEHFPLDAGI